MTLVAPNGEQLAIISDLLEKFKIHVHVEKVYALEQARCARHPYPALNKLLVA